MLLKQFSLEGQAIRYIPGGYILPLSLLDYFANDVNLLSETCRDFAPLDAGCGMLQLHTRVQGQVVKIKLASSQSLFVYNEVFGQQVYGFSLPGNCILVDVGMNIGMASLYFAAHPFIKKIFSYELVPQTYRLAKANLSLNPSISDKISIHEYGWGVTAGTYDLGTVDSGATDASILGAQLTTIENSIANSVVAVSSATEVLHKILAHHPGLPAVLKLDVEGVEYQVLPALAEAGLLAQLQGLMIEWHNGEFRSLLETLSAAGFKSTYRIDPVFAGRLGMIYAWR